MDATARQLMSASAHTAHGSSNSTILHRNDCSFRPTTIREQLPWRNAASISRIGRHQLRARGAPAWPGQGHILLAGGTSRLPSVTSEYDTDFLKHLVVPDMESSTSSYSSLPNPSPGDLWISCFTSSSNGGERPEQATARGRRYARAEEAGWLQDHALHLSERFLRPVRDDRLQRQPDHVPDAAAAPAARRGLQHAHQLPWVLQPHPGHRRPPRRLLHRPLLDHRCGVRHLPARHGQHDILRAAPIAPPAALRGHDRNEPGLRSRVRLDPARPPLDVALHVHRHRGHVTVRHGVRRRPVRARPAVPQRG
uniref:Uncharacterized protein n=1 Tax=Setaria viridis TaxID=4556 RepID=A0A4U6VFA6_SETVI|nr:hypothetical protein SEVIR_3G248901v2 [Setaria viridis]